MKISAISNRSADGSVGCGNTLRYSRMAEFERKGKLELTWRQSGKKLFGPSDITVSSAEMPILCPILGWKSGFAPHLIGALSWM